MPTKRTTTTTTKKVEEVNPTEEIVIEQTPVDAEEDFNLEKKVTVRSIAEWTTGFQRIETNGDVTIPPNGTVRLCQCSCGNPELVSVSTHTLNRGYTQSCGCYRKEKAKQDNTIHGMTGTKIHNKWLSLIDRENVCDEWKYNFMNFYDWSMSHGYKNDLFLCRVDLDKGFNPDNCKWMTKKEYVRKNQSKLYTYKGKTMTLPEWSEYYGINIRTLNNRINKYGMSIEEALTKPIKKKHYYTYNNETHSLPEWAKLTCCAR